MEHLMLSMYTDTGMMGMTGGSGGLIDSLKAKLSFLPEPVAILVIAAGVILLAMLVGFIGGKIIGSILYPDPDKPSILSKKQKFAVLGGVVAAIGVTLFALTYTPPVDTGDDALPVDGMSDGMTDGMTDGTDEGLDGESADGEDGETTDGETADAETDGSVSIEEEAPAASTGGGAAVAVPMI